MTIHTDHPFADAAGDRDPSRRLRGRLAGRVTLWTTGTAGAGGTGGTGGDAAPVPGRTGLTVSSVMVAGGDPAEVVGLVDPDSDLGEALEIGTVVAVSLLDWEHRALADAFAGVAPAPGGAWRLSAWTGDDHPPVPYGVTTYALTEVVALEVVGWSLMVRASVREVRVQETPGAVAGPPEERELVHHRGRYRRLAPPGGSSGSGGSGGSGAP